jgi:hypothetical protein
MLLNTAPEIIKNDCRICQGVFLALRTTNGGMKRAAL